MWILILLLLLLWGGEGTWSILIIIMSQDNLFTYGNILFVVLDIRIDRVSGNCMTGGWMDHTQCVCVWSN